MGLRYKVDHPTMKIEKDGQMRDGSGIPVCKVKITTRPWTKELFRKNIDTKKIVEVFNKIDFEYLFGTGHWTPSIDEIKRLNEYDIENAVDYLYNEWVWCGSPKNYKSSKNILSNCYSYFYKFTINVRNGRISIIIEFV